MRTESERQHQHTHTACDLISSSEEELRSLGLWGLNDMRNYKNNPSVGRQICGVFCVKVYWLANIVLHDAIQNALL
jgi:hypothetical protein